MGRAKPTHPLRTGSEGVRKRAVQTNSKAYDGRRSAASTSRPATLRKGKARASVRHVSHAPAQAYRSMHRMPPCSVVSHALQHAAAAARFHAPRRAASARAGQARRQPPHAALPGARSRCRIAASAQPEASSEQDELAWERRLAAPRMEAGLDVHRRVHVLASKHAAYLFQWRAFCERQGRSFLDTLSDEDEAVLACACSPARVGALALHRLTSAALDSFSPRNGEEPVPV